jgi:hypothetical protein
MKILYKNNDSRAQTKRMAKRENKRARSIKLAEARKNERIKITNRETKIKADVVSILKKESAEEKIITKRPKINYFNEAFSFIPKDVYNQLIETENDEWQCRSFNEERQYIEFFKRFIYPYDIPKPLLLTAVIQNKYYFDADRKQLKSFDFDLIQLCRKWLCDIVSGKSFYKSNKEYFTKHEAHFFLSSKIKYIDTRSVLQMFFEAKCKARCIPDSLSNIIAQVFTVKFEQCFNNIIVTSFLDLISRHIDYNIAREELGDVCDFILSEITKYKESNGKATPFSCSGRTMSSVISLANEWHVQVQREATARAELQEKAKLKKLELWKGLPINNFTFENKKCVWGIKQLCSFKELVNEGRSMHHCVASYAERCSLGTSAIFHVSGCEKKDKSQKLIFSSATVEIRSADRSICQIKGKCNASVDMVTINFIRRWAQANNIKMSTY